MLFAIRSLICYKKANLVQLKKKIELVKELFSSLRGAGCWQGSANKLIVLSSRQAKLATSSNQHFFSDESSSFKEKPKTDREWKAIHLNPTADAGGLSSKCIYEKLERKGKAVKTKQLSRLLLVSKKTCNNIRRKRRVQTKTSSYAIYPPSFSPHIISSWHKLSACTP